MKVPKFNNGDLQSDLEKILSHDVPTLGKDTIDNEGTPSYILDVSDTGYSYANKEERDKDFEKLTKYLLSYENSNSTTGSQG